MNQAANNMKYGARKTYQIAGKWIEKKTKTEILVCPTCTDKYIKTRKNQKVCIRCISKLEDAKRAAKR